MEEAYDDAFESDWTRRGLNLRNDRTRQFAEHMVPLSVIGAGGWDLGNWVQEYEEHWRAVAAERDGTEAEKAERHAENTKEFG